ncbi:MAG: antitoxin HicB [Marmoricola sp.]
MKKTYNVSATKWSGGWELHIEGEGVTQCKTLDKAETTVRDYLQTLHEADFSDMSVVVVPDLGPLTDEVAAARAAVEESAKAQVLAGEQSRRVARELRARGLSVTDTAAVLGVSRGRVSQLVG